MANQETEEEQAPAPTPGEIIKTARDAQGLTQIELAEISGVSDSTIKRIESGQTSGSWKTLTLLADSLGISLDGSAEPLSPIKQLYKLNVENFQRLNEALRSLDDSLDGVERSLDALEQRMSAVEQRLSELGG